MDINFKEYEDKMKKAVSIMEREFSTLRAGRASTALVENMEIDYYGTPTPLNQLAGITVPEPRLIVIQPWDKGVMKEIEREILKSDLGLTPNNDGTVIRLAIPQLTEERRKELFKLVKKRAEECRVAVRNLRRDANDSFKAMEKDGSISEDMRFTAQEKMQKITDEYMKEIDKVLESKEQDIMEV